MIALPPTSWRQGESLLLDQVAFSAAPGHLVAVVGPNGAGKTSLLRALAGLHPGGRPRPAQVAYLPQGAQSAWGLSVRDLAALGRIPHNDRDPEAIAHALDACGITHLCDARIDRLSGGQVRRAMLARAFATRPDIFLLDEPTADLDPAAAHQIMSLLQRTAKSGRCVIVVLHALELATRYADRMVLMQHGRIAADDAPDIVMPFAAAAFGMRLGIDCAPRLLPPR